MQRIEVDPPIILFHHVILLCDGRQIVQELAQFSCISSHLYYSFTEGLARPLPVFNYKGQSPCTW